MDERRGIAIKVYYQMARVVFNPVVFLTSFRKTAQPASPVRLCNSNVNNLKRTGSMTKIKGRRAKTVRISENTRQSNQKNPN